MRKEGSLHWSCLTIASLLTPNNNTFVHQEEVSNLLRCQSPLVMGSIKHPDDSKLPEELHRSQVFARHDPTTARLVEHVAS